MSPKLSPVMAEALERAQEAGLKYLRGGYWVQGTVDGEAFLAQGPVPARPWHTTTHTVQALVRRGLLQWTGFAEKGGYPVEAKTV